MNEEAAASVVNSEVQRHLLAAAQGIFSRPVLQRALTYAQQVPLRFLQVVLPSQVSASTAQCLARYSFVQSTAGCSCRISLTSCQHSAFPACLIMVY